MDTNRLDEKRKSLPLRELVVPVLLLVGVGAYALDAVGLSVEALVFPIVLAIVVVMAASASTVAAVLQGSAGSHEEEGPVLELRPWLLLLIPLVFVWAIEILGAFVALAAIVFGAQWALGERSLVRSAAVALLVTLPTYLLFKQLLYVRFPAGLLGLG